MCEKRKKHKKKIRRLSKFLKLHISGTPEVISLKFGVWGTEVGGRVHSKNCLVSSRQHRATEVRKSRFCSSCQYTHGYCVPASWVARHTTVCLDNKNSPICAQTCCFHKFLLHIEVKYMYLCHIKKLCMFQSC